jgi:hypothetical protein
LLNSSGIAIAQEKNNSIQLSFVKSVDSVRTTELYFNVLRIVNNSSNHIGGEVSFTGPENWKIITFPQNQEGLDPGDTAWIPIRVSPSVDAVGGITYIISASLRTRDIQVTENAYVTLPSKVKWDFFTDKSSFFFTEQNPDATVRINLSNKGNTNELIKVHFQIGRLLVFPNSSNGEYSVYVDLPAFRDTVISYTLSFQKKMTYEEKTRYENNWKESALIATASTETTEKSIVVMMRKLNSSFQNKRAQNSSPLNVDYQVYNLMSNQKARSNIRTYGSILFPESRDFQYSAAINNVYFGKGSNNNFDVYHQLLYTLRYSDRKNNVMLGYNINGGSIHPINGRGISGTYQMNSKSKISYALAQNPSDRSFGEYLGYSSRIKGISVNTGVTNENNSSKDYSATSVVIGTGFTLFKYHSISMQLLGSQAVYRQMPPVLSDTSILGFSYRLSYVLQYKKLELRASSLNSAGNYIRNSGRQQIYIDGKYSLNDKIRFVLNGQRQHYSITHYPNNFFFPSNFSSNDFFRLTASFSSGNLMYNIGPNYIGSMRQFYNPYSKYISLYKTYQPGIWGSTTIKLNGYRSISPNLTITNLRFNYSTEDTSLQNYSFNNNIYYSAGINYYDNKWKVSAYYSSGSTTDLYKSIQIDQKPAISRSIQFRPSYEKYLFERKVKLSAYVNYAYYMPSGRENVSYNLKYDHYLKKGWAIYVSGYMYSNTRVDEELGRINSKDINFIAGISKSFDIQQPRLKYYDLKIIFFNDIDGNLIKTENEPPVSNIKVNIEKDQSLSAVQSNIPLLELISDLNGEIFFENLPRDYYKLSFTPLVNLQSLYFLNGSEQVYFNDQKNTLYIPLAESYKIKGKIILIRDPNSSEGIIDLEGIRISALGVSGGNYSALTDKFGSFILNVPKADKYSVSVNNVFGEQFSIDNDERQVQFTGSKTISLDFTFIEKRREIKFNEGKEIYQFKSLDQNKLP